MWLKRDVSCKRDCVAIVGIVGTGIVGKIA